MTYASLCACDVNASLRIHSVANWVPMLLGHEDALLSNFRSCTVHFDVIKVLFISPKDALSITLKLKFTLKFTLKFLLHVSF